MSVLGASRFTAVLAAVTIAGMVGTFWWALETRSEIKAVSSGDGASRGFKLTGRASRSKDERSGKFHPHRFELMGSSERSQPAPQSGLPALASGTDRSIPAPMLANYPDTGVTPVTAQAADAPLQSMGNGDRAPFNSRADMPLPAQLSTPPRAEPAARPDPAPWVANMSGPPILPPQPPAASPPAERENSKRQTREARNVARAAKTPAPSYYTEMYIEGGEYRYRRRMCEPPKMPDVCFMPQADRQPVFARP